MYTPCDVWVVTRQNVRRLGVLLACSQRDLALRLCQCLLLFHAHLAATRPRRRSLSLCMPAHQGGTHLVPQASSGELLSRSLEG